MKRHYTQFSWVLFSIQQRPSNSIYFNGFFLSFFSPFFRIFWCSTRPKKINSGSWEWKVERTCSNELWRYMIWKKPFSRSITICFTCFTYLSIPSVLATFSWKFLMIECLDCPLVDFRWFLKKFSKQLQGPVARYTLGYGLDHTSSGTLVHTFVVYP